MPASPPLSYCGPPPLPAELWGRWNLDPLLLMVMAASLGAYLLGQARSGRDLAAFSAAIAVLAVIFISPLCALTVSLFSARVVHHVLLVAVAAPLLAVALIGLPRPRRALSAPLLLPVSLGAHTALFWLWHAPDAYGMALSSTAVYWAMQATLAGSATLFWAAVLLARPPQAIATLVAATAQMGLLGALLVFSAQPLYWPHLETTAPFGLDPLSDQQLGGLIMWVPAGLPYLLVAALRLMAFLEHRETGRA